MRLCCKYYRRDLELSFYPHLLSPELAAGWFDYLEGFLAQEPRRTTVLLGDPGIIYTIRYRDEERHRMVIPWDQIPALFELKTLIEEVTHQRYTVCVIQRYPNGSIGIGPHRDKEMVSGTRIVGLSLGATRTLEFTRPDLNPGVVSIPTELESLQLPLPPGSLYVMHPPTNQKWRHSILRASKMIGPRISLTFRTYI